MSVSDRTVDNLMPPPKRLVRNEQGLLRAVTFEGIADYVRESIDARCIHSLIDDALDHFRFQARLKMQGLGKCGLVFRIDAQSRDGYYLSLDLHKGVAQLRAWGTGEDGSGEHMM
jgi:beta-fructofuranosidase